MKAIDLYSGVGGWTVGLQSAGIDVVASYEISDRANETNRKNNGHPAFTADIRALPLRDLPRATSIVVGSPPCTQFSFSNRGGRGNLSDGLEDIKAFLRIVEHVQPKAWAMENVPRLGKILDSELREGGALAEFRHLNLRHQIFDMEKFGVPQRRRRCIVGNFDFDLLRSYETVAARRTLGCVVSALQSNPAADPNFADILPQTDLADHQVEESLDAEEVRINRSLKALHPVYNAMRFPDDLDRPSRTITATCTRVSRESIVIQAPESPGSFRRLTVRERATCQGFPITYQFYANSFSEKLRMVGNAVPPVFAFYVAQALKGTPVEELPASIVRGPTPKVVRAPVRSPDRRVLKYKPDRSFQFAIPSLRLGSGVRFELTNGVKTGSVDWQVRFVFGTPKSIQSIRPTGPDLARFLAYLSDHPAAVLGDIMERFATDFKQIDFEHLQAVWSHRGPGATRPFMLLDMLDDVGASIRNGIADWPTECRRLLMNVASVSDATVARYLSLRKITENADVVAAGLFLASAFNGAATQADDKPRQFPKVLRIAS